MRAFFFFVGVASVAGQVVNGGFEGPALSSTLNVSGEFSLPGWSGWMPSVGGNGGLVVGVDNGLGPFEGRQHFTFNGGNPSDRGWLEQSFSTVAGAAYVVNFAVGRAGGGQGLSMEARVLEGASVFGVGSFAPPGGRGYVEHSMGFTGSGGVMTLRFLDTSGGNSISDLYLDGVSLGMSAVPEPGAWGAIAGSVVLGGAVVRRRRRRWWAAGSAR